MKESLVQDEAILVIDIGGTSVKFGYLCQGEPHDYTKRFSTDELRVQDPVDSLAKMMRDVCADATIEPSLVVVTVPGLLDPAADRVIFSGNIAQLKDVRLATDLSAKVGLPVVLERDSILALYGDAFVGVAKGARHVLGLYFGTGIGAAYLEDGKPVKGTGWALELGHIPFKGEGKVIGQLPPDALEAYVSGQALQLIAKKHGVEISSVFDQSNVLPSLQAELDTFIEDQAFAIAMSIGMFSPEVTVIGGGLCEMSGFPKERLLALIAQRTPFVQYGRKLDIRWSNLGWKSNIYGAQQAANAYWQKHR